MNRYIVFLKQVPLSTKIKIDPVTNTLQRASVQGRTNPDDLYALEAALWMKRHLSGEVIAVTMGPTSAEEVLREALQRGADRAVLVSDRAFAGSDTWCTSLVLASVAEKIGDYKTLFFGRMAIDGDTAQVGPEVAAHLNIPQVTQLSSIVEVNEETLIAARKCNNLEQVVEVEYPCVLIVSKSWGQLKSPTLKGWRRANNAVIEYLNAEDLGIDSDRVGLLASPTRVVETHVPTATKEIVMFDLPGQVGEFILENVKR